MSPRVLFVLVLLCPWLPGRAAPRVAWEGSRFAGTPEAAKPFGAERVRAGTRFEEALELVRVPEAGRFLAVERRGRVFSFPMTGEGGEEEVIDLRARQERLSIAFSAALAPRYRETREIYVMYALREGDREGSRVARFRLSSLEPLRADPASEEVLITWRAGGHNGCSLQFGPDGLLYISTGDSGPSEPPDLYDTGQDVRDLEGGILRIDVTRREGGKAYAVPADNPWVGRADVRPELWCYGLRNPWRMSFDPVTGNLWCGDIGWERWEMVHLIRRGANYGWGAYEASQAIKPHLFNPLAPITPPVVAHPHSEAASITGGFVYRGRAFPELVGAYLYGDYATGRIWALWHDGERVTRHEEIADTPHAILAFAPDDAGEPHYLHYAGQGSLHRLVRNPKAGQAGKFPRRLSETGLFADVRAQVPAAGVAPYAVGTPLWQDGASARRWIALPGECALETSVRRRRDRERNTTVPVYTTRWPHGAVLARTVTLGALALTDAERARPVETQVLHYDGEAWQAYAYRWNEAGTDAELVPAAGAEMTLRVAADPLAGGGGARDYVWRFASRAECLRCHNSWHQGVLGFTALQLHGAGEAQLTRLLADGVVNENFAAQVREVAERPKEDWNPARAWLHANCATCHSLHAGGSANITLNGAVPTAKMAVLGEAPMQGALGLRQPKIVDPGAPWNSVLAVRLAKLGSGHMPAVGARDVDVQGLHTIEDWIAGLASAAAGEAAPQNWDRATVEHALASVEGAMRLRRAIEDGVVARELREEAFQRAWESGNAVVRDLFERFKPAERRERTLGATVDTAAVLRLGGDAERGAKLLGSEGKLASCLACHVVRGEGRHVGPELTRIGAQQPAAQILASIVAPSQAVAPLYRTTVVTTRDGVSHAGFVRARGAKELVLATAGGGTERVALAELVREETSLTSLMPEGLLAGVTAQEAADLVAFLASLR